MYKICIERLSIPSDISISALFETYAHLPFAMLLDSGNTPHMNAKYDIFVANPIDTISLVGDTHSADNLFNQTHSATQQHFAKHEIPLSPLPFLVGAIGYASYDYGRHLEVLPELNEPEYHASEFAVGIYSWSVIKDKESGSFYLCYSNKYPHPDAAKLSQVDSSKVDNFALTSDWKSNVDVQQYHSDIATIHDYLKAGDCYQINYAQRFNAQYQGDEWQAYAKLQHHNQSPFSAFLRFDNYAIVSCSPERFLLCQNGKVETKPIKGTMPRSNAVEQDNAIKQQLQHSEKDRAENLMIVDLLRNDLSKNCQPHSVKVEKLFEIESFAAVHHLVSTITAQLNENVTPLHLLKDAFPGGSITGAPKIRAMEIIEELEGNRRHVYCGSIFYYGIRGDLDSNICIRTLLFENNTVYCWAGGGIVVDSIAEHEYQETLDKVNKILPILAD
ncbi:MAG: aminodeoxychorismate synthase component I [Aestuariibacter sp.]